jgi:predicted phosphoribosyltransferase
MENGSVNLPFEDRFEAGRLLGNALGPYASRTDVLMLALPRGGVPVAFAAAEVIDVPLDLMLVRKLGVPGRTELAMGAIATGGTRLVNQEVVSLLDISADVIDRVAEREELELARREATYRGGLPGPEVGGRCVILVDDGLATGATMRAAVAALRQKPVSEIVVAVPVASLDALRLLRDEVDGIVCLAAPARFYAVGQWYRDFTQVTDEEVRGLLERARRRMGEQDVTNVDCRTSDQKTCN